MGWGTQQERVGREVLFVGHYLLDKLDIANAIILRTSLTISIAWLRPWHVVPRMIVILSSTIVVHHWCRKTHYCRKPLLFIMKYERDVFTILTPAIAIGLRKALDQDSNSDVDISQRLPFWLSEYCSNCWPKKYWRKMGNPE